MSYTYDLANRLTKVADVTGDIDITPDADGRTQDIVFPETDRTKVSY